jgi:hypothetical protein
MLVLGAQAGISVLGAGCWVLGAGCLVLGGRCSVLSAGCSVLGAAAAGIEVAFDKGGGTVLNKRTFAYLAGMLGSAVASWWWVRHQTLGRHARQNAQRERGTVIFSNTPTVVG